MDYTICCKVVGDISFTISAETLEDAVRIGRERAAKMNPFKKELEWVDGNPVVNGVFEND